MKSTFNFLMLALVSQAASLVISNECGSDASCMDIKDHKELKKRECKTFEKKELLKIPFSKHEFGDKKGSPKREEIKKIIADHKAKGKGLIEKSSKVDAGKGKPPKLQTSKKPKKSSKPGKRPVKGGR